MCALTLVLLACGGPSEDATAQARAATEFACAVVTVAHVGTDCHNGGKYDSGCWDVFRASGCHQTAEYECFGDMGGGECPIELFHTSQTSTVTINGAPLYPDGNDACTSAAPFVGVVLSEPGGGALRLVENPDLTVEATATAADGSTSGPLKDCVTMTIDGLRGGETGGAKLDCHAPGWDVVGEVNFQDCVTPTQ